MAVPTPVLTHVCKRGGCPPCAFRLLPCGCPPGACSPAPNRVGLPILRCWIKIERPAPALQERSRVMIPQSRLSTSRLFTKDKPLAGTEVPNRTARSGRHPNVRSANLYDLRPPLDRPGDFRFHREDDSSVQHPRFRQNCGKRRIQQVYPAAPLAHNGAGHQVQIVHQE